MRTLSTGCEKLVEYLKDKVEFSIDVKYCDRKSKESCWCQYQDWKLYQFDAANKYHRDTESIHYSDLLWIY